MTKRLFLIWCILFVVSVVAFYYCISGDSFFNSTSPSEIVIGNQDDSQWFKISGIRRIKGVALVVHGLNLKPERMQSIIAELNNMGIDVLNLSLRGHGKNYQTNFNISSEEARLESFRTVTYNLWMEEIYKAYRKVRARASKKNVPVFFIGYSLGGLMGCDLALMHPDVFYDRMVLFAPALNITVESYLLKALLPFPNIVIDSLSPVYYRTNKGTPMAAYKALFEAGALFEKNVNDKLNKPTLIFIDEKDEFVSCAKLTEMIACWNFDQWQIHIVKKDDDVGKNISHHLIIDRDSVGRKMWKQIRDTIKRHLSIGN
jgi:esterase/lipase